MKLDDLRKRFRPEPEPEAPAEKAFKSLTEGDFPVEFNPDEGTLTLLDDDGVPGVVRYVDVELPYVKANTPKPVRDAVKAALVENAKRKAGWPDGTTYRDDHMVEYHRPDGIVIPGQIELEVDAARDMTRHRIPRYDDIVRRDLGEKGVPEVRYDHLEVAAHTMETESNPEDAVQHMILDRAARKAGWPNGTILHEDCVLEYRHDDALGPDTTLGQVEFENDILRDVTRYSIPCYGDIVRQKKAEDDARRERLDAVSWTTTKADLNTMDPPELIRNLTKLARAKAWPAGTNISTERLSYTDTDGTRYEGRFKSDPRDVTVTFEAPRFSDSKVPRWADVR